MKILIKNKSYPVSSFEEASNIYSQLRDRSGQRASTFPDGIISDEKGDAIAHVSYNGKVWRGSDYAASNKELLYNPYK